MNRRCGSVVALAFLAACGTAEDPPSEEAPAAGPTIGRIERLDARLDAVVPRDAELEILADGHEWTEGPVWVTELGSILYSDIPNDAIYRWSEGGEAAIWLEASGASNGLVLDAEGRLLLAQHGDRRIARLTTPLADPVSEFETLADRFEGARFNSPNDLALRGNGDLYFTDPPYGLAGGAEDPARELGIQGVYRRSADGSVTLLVDDLSRPNGIAFSPEEDVLYVANSDRSDPRVMAYDVRTDGTLADGRVLFDSWGDGLAVDTAGRVYVAGPGDGVAIVAPDGTHLGTIVTTEATSNVAFGDDGSTLYITADTYLLRIRLHSLGMGFGDRAAPTPGNL